jgi:hypothetical protein
VRITASPVFVRSALLILAFAALAPARSRAAASAPDSLARVPSPVFAQRLSIGFTAALGVSALAAQLADEKDAAAFLGATAIVAGPATGYFYGRSGLRGFGGAVIRGGILALPYLSEIDPMGGGGSEPSSSVVGVAVAAAALDAVYDIVVLPGKVEHANQVLSPPRQPRISARRAVVISTVATAVPALFAGSSTVNHGTGEETSRNWEPLHAGLTLGPEVGYAAAGVSNFQSILGVVGRGGLIAYMASKDVYRGPEDRPADSEDVARSTTTVMAIWALADIVMLPRAFKSHETRSSTLEPANARVRFASVPLRTRPGENALAIRVSF